MTNKHKTQSGEGMKKIIIALIFCLSFAFVNPSFAEEVIEDRSFCNEEIPDWDKQKLLQRLHVTVLGGLISSRAPDETTDHQDKVLFNPMLYQQEIGAYSFATAKSLLLSSTAQERCAWKTEEEQSATPPEQVATTIDIQITDTISEPDGSWETTVMAIRVFDGDGLPIRIGKYWSLIGGRFEITVGHYATRVSDDDSMQVDLAYTHPTDIDVYFTAIIDNVTTTILIPKSLQVEEAQEQPPEQVFKEMYVSEGVNIGTNTDGAIWVTFVAFAYDQNGDGMPGLKFTVEKNYLGAEPTIYTTGEHGSFLITLTQTGDETNGYGNFSILMDGEYVYRDVVWYFPSMYLNSIGRPVR